MGSSRVRRQARRFCCSALKGGSRIRWRDFRTVWVRDFPEKADRPAEKSRRSKRRSHRGRRTNKHRARGGKPRLAIVRQPVTKPVGDRLLRRKVFGPLDFWEGRRDLVVRLIKPYASRKFEKGDRNAYFGSSFDAVRYRWCRDLFEKLRARACKVAAVKMAFEPNWSFFLEKHFGFVIKGHLSIVQSLMEMRFDLEDRYAGIPVPSWAEVTRVPHNRNWRRDSRKKTRGVTASLPVKKKKKQDSLCSGCGCVLGRAHMRPDCPVRVAARAKRANSAMAS